jgi:hypothetical protein
MKSCEVRAIRDMLRSKFILSVESHLFPDRKSRKSSFYPHELATLLAKAVLEPSPSQWPDVQPEGRTIFGTHPLDELNPFMTASLTILEQVCGTILPEEVRARIPSAEEIMKQLAYPYSHDTTYILPFHLASMALLCMIKGTRVPQLLLRIRDLQQPDGSWSDDTVLTAMAVLALEQGKMTLKYDARAWLEQERRPDGKWAAVNGEVWEASYALKPGEYHDPARLVHTLQHCMHSNLWWGFSRYAVPDVDDTAVACYALAPYCPDVTRASLTTIQAMQHESGGWGTFPFIEDVVPHERVVGIPNDTVCEITCHVLEAMRHNTIKNSAFKRGISYLLDTQQKDGHWTASWWNRDTYATAEIALLLNQEGSSEAAFRAFDWLGSKSTDTCINVVECALMVEAFSSCHPEYADDLDRMLKRLIDHKKALVHPTFNFTYFAGLLDPELYRLSKILSSINTFLKSLHQ